MFILTQMISGFEFPINRASVWHGDRHTLAFVTHEITWCWAYVLVAYRQVSNIRRTLAGNEFVDHSDVVGASPVGAAPTTSSFST